MRRLGALLVIVVVVLAARFALERPVDVELDLDYGPTASALREASLVFTAADDRVERELRLVYGDGAPLRERRSVRLPEGRCNVGARLVYEGRPPLTTSRPLSVERAGTYSLELH